MIKTCNCHCCKRHQDKLTSMYTTIINSDDQYNDEKKLKGDMTKLQSSYDLLRQQALSLRDALKVAALGETQFDGVEAMHSARTALASFNKFLEGES